MSYFLKIFIYCSAFFLSHTSARWTKWSRPVLFFKSESLLSFVLCHAQRLVSIISAGSFKADDGEIKNHGCEIQLLGVMLSVGIYRKMKVRTGSIFWSFRWGRLHNNFMKNSPTPRFFSCFRYIRHKQAYTFFMLHKAQADKCWNFSF